MKNLMIILSLAFLSTALGLSASKYEETYTFGDDMADFVRDSAYLYVMRQLPEEYASRSLNGFQVTMDKARKSANRATDSLVMHFPQLRETTEKVQQLITKINSDNPVSRQEVAQLAAYSTDLSSLSLPIAAAFEEVIANRKMLHSLDRPLNLEEFKKEGLHLVPLTFVRSAFGGAPDFNSSINVTVTVYSEGGGAAEQNGVQGGFFLFDMFEQEKKRDEYNDQMKKYDRAFDRLPELMPPDTLSYRLYLEGFRAIEKIYDKEPSILSNYMDSLQVTLMSTYTKTMALKRLVDNALLSDRVAAIYKALSLQNFSEPDQQKIRQKSFEINRARSRLVELRSRIKSSKNRTVSNFIDGEGISDIAEQVVRQLEGLDSLPLFIPLHQYIPSQRKWFSAQRDWANSYLKGKTMVEQQLHLSNLPYGSSIKLKGDQKAKTKSNGPVMKISFNEGGYPHLSVGYNWPGSGANQSHESIYDNGGGPVWTRNSDGAYARDQRASGGYMVGHAKRNMNLRTRTTKENYTGGISQARSNYPTRISEIGNQKTHVRALERKLTSGFSSIPLPTLPGPIGSISSFPVSIPELTDPQQQNGIQRTSTERQRSRDMVANEGEHLPTTLADYEKLHDRYTQYAAGLYRAGYKKQADWLLEAATGMRAERMGFLEPGQVYPTLSFPNIPFEPFSIADYNTVRSRNEVYEMTDRNMGDRSHWFEAAAMVTGPATLGIADLIPKGETVFSAPLDFLRAGNQTLFPLNMANASKILSNSLNDSFVTPGGDHITFSGLTGKALDYALVLYEQTMVENFIKAYSEQHPEINMAAVIGTINFTMRHSPTIPAEVQQALPDNFDFSNFNDRVRLGQRLIDILYARHGFPSPDPLIIPIR